MRKIFLLLGVVMSLYAKTQVIVFGAGCFWGVEKYFSEIDGVLDVKSGYAGGNYENPSYEKVLAHRRSLSLSFLDGINDGVVNHTEVVQVQYDAKKLPTQKIIKLFWELHDPTQGNAQGNDRGNNYRSAIYYTTLEQKNVSFETKELYQKLLKAEGYSKITTEIKQLKKFYPAEEYHQDYLRKNPNGYCPNHATGVKFITEKKKSFITPLKGKEIVVVDAKNCPFCERFKKDVLKSYKGTLSLRVVKAEELKGFKLEHKIVGTPTILFVEDGIEKFSHVGYMDEKKFYKAVALLKLSKKSEAYSVAFEQSTDRSFCRAYDIFKETADGVFRDKISGEILFDTKDRFNSGTGWLSFYKAVDGATIEKIDNSYGMKRVEVIAKKSGAHLGHVFANAPNGRNRFCINATILEFVKREDIK